MNRRVVGIASTLVGASLWGFSGTCSQFLLSNYPISSLFITMVRMLGAGVLFLAVLLVRSRAQLREALSDPWSRRHFVLFGVVGLYLCQLTYVISIGYTNAGTATVMQSLNIVVIMVVTCITARRLPRVFEILGFVLAFVATVLIATQGDLGGLRMPPLGFFWGLVTAVTAAVYSLLPRPLYPKWGSFMTVGVGMLVGGIAAFAVWACAFVVPGIDAVASGGSALGSALVPQLDVKGLAALAVIAVVGTFAAFYLFLNGLSIIGAVQGSQLGAMEPVSATVCSVVFLGTVFSVFDWVGLVLMVITTVIVAAGKAE